MAWLKYSVIVSLACFSAACGEDEAVSPNPGGSGGTGASGGTSGSGGMSGAAGSGATDGGGSAGTGASGGTSGSGGTTGSGGTGGGAETCTQSVTASSLASGSWDTRFTIPGFSTRFGIAPAVYDFARDKDGSLLAAGRFDFAGASNVAPLMRWKDGSWQPARTRWELPAPADGFSAIAVSPEGQLALATNDSFGERSGEVWVDDGSGLRSIGGFQGQVRSLAFFGGRLWMAGLFKLAGAVPAQGLALWDGTAWAVAPGGRIVGSAFELYVDGGALLVGGAFSKVGGVNAANVAAYDGTSWTAHDFPGALAVYALGRTDGGTLYAGGAFGNLDAAGGFARWTGSAWQMAGGGLGQLVTRGVVTDLVIHGEVVDVTGCFTSAGGLEGAAGAVATRSVARWSGTAWQALDDAPSGVATPWFQPGACGDEAPTAIWDVSHQRLALDGPRLVAGGMFGGIDGVLSQSIIAHDGQNWVAQGAGSLGIAGSIDRIRETGEGCGVYGVGTFTHVAGAPAVGRVVHFDGSSWKNLSDSLPSDAWCPALDVSAEGELAVGCMFQPDSGDALGTVLRRQGDSMVASGPGDLAPVMALAWSPTGKLFVTGGGAAGYFARFDGSTFTPIEDGFDGLVNAIDVVSDQDVIVAGTFTHVGSLEASRIARWNGSAWAPLGAGLPGQVIAVERDGATTYASTYDEGNGAYLLGAFDGAEWRELATGSAGLTAKQEFSFNSLRAIPGGLLAVGSAELDDGSGRGALVYRNGAFQALGGGVSAISTDGIAITGGAVWLAGVIAAAGGEASAISSVGVARWKLSSTP
jgi:hypothetical protein